MFDHGDDAEHPADDEEQTADGRDDAYACEPYDALHLQERKRIERAAKTKNAEGEKQGGVLEVATAKMRAQQAYSDECKAVVHLVAYARFEGGLLAHVHHGLEGVCAKCADDYAEPCKNKSEY